MSCECEGPQLDADETSDVLVVESNGRHVMMRFVLRMSQWSILTALFEWTCVFQRVCAGQRLKDKAR